MTQQKLYDIIDPSDGECVRREVEHVLFHFYPNEESLLFNQAFADVERLFSGDYPGYRASNTKYHDFEHTCSVVLAAARLIYGALVKEHSFDQRTALKGILSALFHDVGLIQTEDDTIGTGAKYTVGHEERSIQFMREYLEGSLIQEDIEDIADCIRCTTLSMSPKKVAFRTQEIRLMGYILGSADLIAQIADRYYLEKLIKLFEEFQEARLPGYSTAYELLTKTHTFYQDVARPRLNDELGRVSEFMTPYFQERMSVERDLYYEAIHRNLDYLNSILAECHDDMDCFTKCLRRGEFA